MITDISHNRRHVLGLVMAAFLTPTLPAHALSINESQRFIADVVARVLSVINSGKSEAQMLADFEQIFANYADVNVIARAVVGPDWKATSPKQQANFIAAFQRYVAHKYGRRFREFIGADIHVTGARDAGRKGVLVQSVVDLKGHEPFEVVWQVSDRSGSIRYYNLIIEGVSLLATEQVEIRALLDQHSGKLDEVSKALAGYS